MKVNRDTVYKALKRFREEKEAGLEDRKRGRPKGISKVDLKAMDAVRRLQQNPNLGEFRIHAALAQVGIHLSPRTCGRILATNRRLYGYEKPKAGSGEKKEMPFQSDRRHEYWTADIRYVKKHKLGGRIYVISILENHSRAILSSTISRSQDLTTFLRILYAAVERYGSPETLVTDGGGVFRATRALTIYEILGIKKKEIERGQPWQSYIETQFNVQRRMADYHFAKAESWAEIVEAHERWRSDYNEQVHYAHQKREDGKHSPQEVLGLLSEVRYRPEDLQRAFFTSRFTRILDSLGYATFRRWRLYGEEGLAKREAALWLGAENLTLEYSGQTLSRYEVRYQPGEKLTSNANLQQITAEQFFDSPYGKSRQQARLFELTALGDSGWIKALRLEDYAPRKPRKPEMLQEVLFSYLDAV